MADLHYERLQYDRVHCIIKGSRYQVEIWYISKAATYLYSIKNS